MGRYWNAHVLERRFSLTNSSHLYSKRPSHRSTPNYPTKTKERVPLSLFVALRLFSRADSRSGVHITIVFAKSLKMNGISTIWPKLNGFGFFLKRFFGGVGVLDLFFFFFPLHPPHDKAPSHRTHSFLLVVILYSLWIEIKTTTLIRSPQNKKK